jgi:hypothetical protein
MALNLLDTIRNSAQVESPGMEDETSKLQRLLRARTGREVTGSEVAASSLGEQQAVQQAQSDIQTQVRPQAQLQQRGLEQAQRTQEQAAELQGAELEQERRFNALENQMQTNRVLQELEQGRVKLDIDRDRAQVNQLAQGIRLQSQEYTDNLERAWERARLDNMEEAKRQIARNEIGAAEKLLRKKLGNKEIIDMKDREWNRSLASIDADSAWQMFQADMAADRRRGLYTGGAGVLTASLGGYGTWEDRKYRRKQAETDKTKG